MAGRGARFGLGILAAAGLLATSASFLNAAEPVAPAGAWAERVQIVYDAASRSVERRTVRAWDFHPEKNLDFVWEPATGQSPDATIAADGTIGGRGRLVWRVRGSASYDPATVYSTYEGELRDGRPDGQGRLELRSGEVFQGRWAAGALDGQGLSIDADGNRYEGAFADGVANGKGRLLSRTGEIFEGTFVGGLKNGEGTTRLPGGTVYRSRWAMGREIGGNRPDVLADARVGGLLKAQAGGGDAGKVEIGVVVDERMTQRSDMQYQNLVRDEDIAIYPVSDQYNGTWNGTDTVQAGGNFYEGMDWEDAPAFAGVWPELAEVVAGVDFLAAHNAAFDRRVLEGCCTSYALPVPNKPFLCTVQLARDVWNLRPTKLPDVARYLCLQLNHHDALSDATACANIVLAAEAEGYDMRRRIPVYAQ